MYDSIEIADYLRLVRGNDMKNKLQDWGIETNASLFNLASKDVKWFWRQVQHKVALKTVIEKLKNEAGDEDWIYTLKHYLGK